MSNKDIVKKMYQAYIEGNRDMIDPLIAEDFHFTSPLDNKINRNTYFERCWPNNVWISDFQFIHVLEDGDRVFVTYEGQSKEGKKFRNTELITLKNGQAVDVEVYFGWNLPHEAKPGGFVAS